MIVINTSNKYGLNLIEIVIAAALSKSSVCNISAFECQDRPFRRGSSTSEQLSIRSESEQLDEDAESKEDGDHIGGMLSV